MSLKSINRNFSSKTMSFHLKPWSLVTIDHAVTQLREKVRCLIACWWHDGEFCQFHEVRVLNLLMYSRGWQFPCTPRHWGVEPWYNSLNMGWVLCHQPQLQPTHAHPQPSLSVCAMRDQPVPVQVGQGWHRQCLHGLCAQLTGCHSDTPREHQDSEYHRLCQCTVTSVLCPADNWLLCVGHHFCNSCCWTEVSCRSLGFLCSDHHSPNAFGVRTDSLSTHLAVPDFAIKCNDTYLASTDFTLSFLRHCVLVLTLNCFDMVFYVHFKLKSAHCQKGCCDLWLKRTHVHIGITCLGIRSS